MVATGAVALFNHAVVAGHPIDTQALRIVVGTGVAVAGLALIENLSTELAVGIAWISLVSVLLVRIEKNTPTPLEAFAKWWNEK